MEEKTRYTKDEKPVFKGPAGKAWKLDCDSFEKKYPDSQSKELLVCQYVVYAPGAHPLWNHYAISCIRLKDVPGVEPAKICLPGATHEIIVLALDPEKPVAINDVFNCLMPVNYCGQFIADDKEAEKRTVDAVKEIVQGTLSPDTDFISQWVKRFGDSNIKKGC